MKNPKMSKRKNAVTDRFTIVDGLDDKYERTLGFYIRDREDDAVRTRLVYMLVNDPYGWDTEKEGPMPLFLHQIEISPNGMEYLCAPMNYLRFYARDHGYPGILCRGKSSSISEEDMEAFLLQYGFKAVGYRKYWLDL